MTSPAHCGPPDYGFVFPSYFTDKDANEKTFQYDEDLPPLPIPTLAHTLSKYLESGKYLLQCSTFYHHLRTDLQISTL